MTNLSSLRLSLRRNTLAACLAASLAATAAGASAPLHRAHDARPAFASSDETIFGALHTSAAGERPNAAFASEPARTSGTPAIPNVAVLNCEDDGPGSLRGAVAYAQDGGAIDLRALTCPTITLDSGEIVATASDLHLLGPGQHALTIQANDASRVFVSNYGLEIADLTVAHGRSTNGVGGCIRVVQGGLTLTRSTVTGCQAGDGSNVKSWGAGVDVIGNLYMQSSTISASTATASDAAYGGGAFVDGTATLEDSTIEGNAAVAASSEARGGGLFAREAWVYDSHLANNTASSANGAAFGGAISSEGGNIKIVRSTISGNTADSEGAANFGFGGGLHAGSVDGSASLQLSDSTLSGNIANGGAVSMGGGAWVAGVIVAFHSTIRDNQASLVASLGRAVGGGLATPAGIAGQITLANSTVSGNSAIAMGGNSGGYGGGISAADSPFAVWNSTIAFNSASTSGGGIVGGAVGGAPQLNSTIVANNSAPSGADVAHSSDVPIVIAGSNNLMMTVGTGITFDVEPIHTDPLLQGLAPNGGPTMTHALAAGSPAINTGNNLLDSSYDQRGCPFARVAASAPDIGAFEVQTGTPDYLFGDDFEWGDPLCP